MNAQELRAKCAELKTSIHALTAERNELSPQAINGADTGPQARIRIRTIDKLRAEHVSELETIEAVLARPEYRDAAFIERLDDTAARQLAQRQAALCRLVMNDYAVIASGAYFPMPIEQVPRYHARELTGETEAQQQFNNRHLLEARANDPHNIEPVSLKIDRLAAKLAACKRHTEQLLATTTLPTYLAPQVDPVTGQRLRAVAGPRAVPLDSGRPMGRRPERA